MWALWGGGVLQRVGGQEEGGRVMGRGRIDSVTGSPELPISF